MGLPKGFKPTEDEGGLKDSDPMPFGKHKGKRMRDVPASYLMWLYENGCNNHEVSEYIENNLSHIEDEADEERSSRDRVRADGPFDEEDPGYPDGGYTFGSDNIPF